MKYHRTLRAATAFSVVVFPVGAFPHGPTPHRITEAVEIQASPDEVWKVVGEFAGFAAWNPAVVAATADKGNAAESTRHVTLKNGAELLDSMDFYDSANMTYTYRLMNEDVQRFPVSFYSATITVRPGGHGSEVE